MFLTQVDEENKLMRALYEKPLLRQEPKREDFGGVYVIGPPRPRRSDPVKMKICQPVVPRFSPTSVRRVDLTPYDDYAFDGSRVSIPPALMAMLTHESESLVFRALYQQPMTGFPQKVVEQVISDLKVYLNKCIKKNMIGECLFLDAVIENIRVDKHMDAPKPIDQTEQVEQRLDAAKLELEEKEDHWRQQKNILEAERELAAEELELKWGSQRTELEEEWNSERVRSRFANPSSKLIASRQRVKALMNVHAFEEAQIAAVEVQKLEDEETTEAGIKMNHEYKQAHERLQERFTIEENAVSEVFESKLNGIRAAEMNDLRSVLQRIENLKRVKENQELSLKRNARNEMNGPVKKAVPTGIKSRPISMNGKLKLPKLKSVFTKPKKQMGRVQSQSSVVRTFVTQDPLDTGIYGIEETENEREVKWQIMASDLPDDAKETEMKERNIQQRSSINLDDAKDTTNAFAFWAINLDDSEPEYPVFETKTSEVLKDLLHSKFQISSHENDRRTIEVKFRTNLAHKFQWFSVTLVSATPKQILFSPSIYIKKSVLTSSCKEPRNY
jgi:hypothetical protein